MFKLHLWIGENVNATLAIGQKEQIRFFVPRYFVHFKLELLLGDDFVRANVNEWNEIFFVTDGNSFAVRSPSNVDIFKAKMLPELISIWSGQH